MVERYRIHIRQLADGSSILLLATLEKRTWLLPGPLFDI